MAEGKRGSSCFKWLGGIMAAVITAVLVWWLTAPGGLLNPKEATQEPRPVLKIVDFQVSDAPVGGQARAEVTVFNEGDSTGEFGTEVTPLLQATKQIDDLGLHRHVERGSRLVEHDEFWF